MGRSQRSPTPKDYPNRGIEHSSFSDIRELVSLPEVEGQSYLHCPISYGGKVMELQKAQAQRQKRAKSSDGEDREILSGVGGVDQLVGYIIPFCQCSQVVSEEKPKLFQMW